MVVDAVAYKSVHFHFSTAFYTTKSNNPVDCPQNMHPGKFTLHLPGTTARAAGTDVSEVDVEP